VPDADDSQVAPPDRPLRADAERNRRRILQAAREVFTEQGLSATMDEVAARAEVGVGTVYRRFPEKDGLIDALFEQRISAIVGAADEGLAHEDAWEGLVHFLTRSQELQAADRGLKELLMSTGRGRDRVAAMREKMRPRAEELVRRAQATGALRDDVSPFDIPLVQLAVGTAVDFSEPLEPEVWRRLLTILLDGLRASRDAPTPMPERSLTIDEVYAGMACWKAARR
jgi:AcrR family transcriptional regulator